MFPIERMLCLTGLYNLYFIWDKRSLVSKIVLEDVANEFHWLFELQSEAVISGDIRGLKVYQTETGWKGRWERNFKLSFTK